MFLRPRVPLGSVAVDQLGAQRVEGQIVGDPVGQVGVLMKRLPNATASAQPAPTTFSPLATSTLPAAMITPLNASRSETRTLSSRAGPPAQPGSHRCR
ncbi:hypothetical protein CA850_27880 [Micromonospora echinospora]|nr:hypothetical protein CA850_27880 [Micromonospora echinospora]